MQKTRDYEEAMLEQRLELFKAYTARNQKDLERWMKEVGLSYDDFGSDVKAKGEKWSTYFQTSLSNHIRQAGTEVMNDNIWTEVGKKMGEKLLKGLGFNDLADFRNFVRTGTMGGGKNQTDNNKGDKPAVHHGGGMIGSGGGTGRGNIPDTYKGLHRSERMVLAQKGEYMVNRKAASKNRGLLEAINNGTDVGSGGIGDGYNMAGLMSGAIAGMFAKGVGKAYQNAYEVGAAKQAALQNMLGGMFSGIAGSYAGLSLDADQMKNAATIASVGSGMGMSVRDLEIGIMTAITESMLRNISGGDRDSAGLFQQRPSQGWGTLQQVTDPQYAARKFFSVLKGVQNRADMSPWMAAQTVQRSAFSDGSNYAKWWGAAQAIFTKGLKRSKGGGYTADGGFISGSGGKHRPINGPVTSGLHGGNSAGDPPALDFAGPVGRPVYAVSDGVITESRDIAGPLPTDRYHDSRYGPYGSFGRMIQMRTNGGAYALYAHLSRRSVTAGTKVKGGSTIGYSGSTGNSSGPHLHFGATNGPYAWLRRGGTVKYDNTPALLHSGESVLTKRLTERFEKNVGGEGHGDSYDMTFDFRGATIREDVDIEKAVEKALNARDARVGRKRVVR